jgi:hypothetical protein
MKQKLTLVLSLLALTTFSFAQKSAKNSENKRRFAGIHLNSLDVATPQSWKDNSGTKSLAGFKNQDLGFSVSYWQTLAHHLDISGKATMMFHNYNAIDRNEYTTKYNQIGFEIEPTVNAYAFNDESKYNAFVTSGLGLGIYSGKFGAYVPAGLGLSLNFSNNTYFMLQSQYRFSLTNDVMKNNLFYSIGICQNLGK